MKYRPKIKLHGTNAAIRMDSRQSGATVFAQSRKRDLTPENDNFGFAQFVHEHIHELRPWWTTNVVLFGEWYGPGVQTGVALAQIPKKCFAVFAAVMDEHYLIDDPQSLQELLGDFPAYVLPWFGEELTFDFDDIDAQAVEHVNAVVENIDIECPWAREMHNVRGHGEGLVFFPSDQEPHTVGEFGRLSWKAKGQSHRTSGKVAAHVTPPPSKDVVDFVNSVLTPPRLEQALHELQLQRGSRADTSAFLKWIGNDVERECAEELKVSGLEWRSVAKVLGRTAAKWFTSTGDAA